MRDPYWLPPTAYHRQLGEAPWGMAGGYWRPPRRYPMSGLGQIPTSAAGVQARIQAEVGNFLAARQELDRMRAKATTADQLAAVESLYAEQGALETELPDTLNAARSLQAGEFNLTLGAQVVSFATRMSAHLNRVRQLRSRMGLGATGFGGGGLEIPWGRIALWGGGAVVGLMVLRAMRRRR